MRTSKISGFYKLGTEKRLEIVRDFAGLNEEEVRILGNTCSLREIADRMIENVVGTMPLPLGIAVNFMINGKDYLIPMAIEEPSVVAAASNAAKMAREKGGFQASSSEPIMVGQIQLTGVYDPFATKFALLANKDRILNIANEKDPMLVNLGGGAKDLEVRVIASDAGPMVIIHLLVNVKDAMGANAVNTMVEAVAPFIEQLTGGKVNLRIISNLATYRLARARAVFAKDAIGGEEVVDGIISAYLFAKSDPYRCATHNKGIMNGIDAVVIATGNDFRAIEAGAHSYASITGKYLPLTHWEKNKDHDLVGTIELPLAVGIIGGATSVHPTAKTNLKILGVKTANELAEIIAAVGLAQNFAALRALATEGIQRGHMSLHARNVAIAAGAKGDTIDRVVEILVREKRVRVDRAKEVLKEMA
ncbi:MAG: hydroxymethylglutaryl-CoA reductase, degradative [Methanophagales archaeon]|nr:hydroxymethylglutaryl-CoA reductase, degradative [Methanophagales archaeon]MCW3141016.1 hydroxymethylglutaryl-CoA reductase, degradative [Methanophagales archaeon]